MPHMILWLRSADELNELSRWLRDTTGYWPVIDTTTLTEDGRTYPMQIITLTGRWNSPQLQAAYVERATGEPTC